MVNREIGSEFWNNFESNNLEKGSYKAVPKWMQLGKEQKLLLAGRTAIDFVLEDISKTKNVRSVYMPSYCCSSMLQPFIDRGIKIVFYNVVSDDEGLVYQINYNISTDIFFATSYFGYQCTTMDNVIKKFLNKDIIVIEDITHRLLSEKNYCSEADYLIASLRKWFPIPTGGLAVKLRGMFKEQELKEAPEEFLKKKTNAMIKKDQYMKDYDEGDKRYKILKDQYLRQFRESNEILQSEYKKYLLDDLSIKTLAQLNIDNIKNKRRENATYIYGNILESKVVRLLLPKINIKEDCPIFVPIKVHSDIRESLKKYLVRNGIYCPVHWPMPKDFTLTTIQEILYQRELSLVCDQRYDYRDMNVIVDLLGEFINDYD